MTDHDLSPDSLQARPGPLCGPSGGLLAAGTPGHRVDGADGADGHEHSTDEPGGHGGHGGNSGHNEHNEHGGNNSHSHGVAANANLKYLSAALALIVGFMIVEVVVAIASGSLALLADAGHMLTDAGAIAGSLWAIRLAAKPAAGVWTFGFKRAEILSAAINGITLLVVATLVGVESIGRLIDPPPVDGGPVLIVAILGVVVNVLATWVLSKANRTSLNIEGAFQHVLSDLYAFIGTAVAGVLILTTGYLRADAIASLIVVVLMIKAAWGLLRDSGRILLEAAPEGVALEEVRAHMSTVPEVLGVHDLHVWTVTSDLPALSAHVVIADHCFTDGRSPMILDRLQQCLHGHFDVEHSTFQLEPAGHQTHEAGHHD